MGNTNSEPGKEAAKATNGSTKERPDESLPNSQRQSLYENAFNSLKEYPYRDRDHHEDPGPDKGLGGWGQNAGPDERVEENIWVERSQRSLHATHQDHQLEDDTTMSHNEMVARLARQPEWTVTGSEAPGIRSRWDSTPATSTGPAAGSERRSGESNRADLLEAGPHASGPAAEDYCNLTASGRAAPTRAGVHEATYSPPPSASIPAVTPYTAIDVNALLLQAAGAPASCANLAVGGGSGETPGKREATTTLVTTATEKAPDEGRAPIPSVAAASESSAKKASVSGETSQRAAVVVTTKIPPVESISSSGATRSAAASSPRAVGREAFQKTASAGSTRWTSGLIPGAARRVTAELTTEDSTAGGLKNHRQVEEETLDTASHVAGRERECEEEGEEEVREEEGEEEGELCSLHRGQRVLAWCATCCTAVCRTCVMVEHSLHKLSNGPSPLEQPGGRQGEEEGEEELDWAEWGVTRWLMKHAALAEDLVAMETAIKREKEDAIAAVEEKVGEVVRAVRAAGSRAVAELEGQAASLLEPLLQRRRQLQEWRHQAADVTASCRRLLKDPGRLQSSSVYDDVTSRLEKLVASGSQLTRGVEGPTPGGHFRPQLDLSGVLDAQASSTSCHVICRLHGDNLHDDRLSGEEGGRAQTPMSCTRKKVGSCDAETKDESTAPRASSGGTAEEGDADSQPASMHSLCVDPLTGQMIIGDLENKRLQRYSPDGKFINQQYLDASPCRIAHSPSALAVVADGDLYIHERGSWAVRRKTSIPHVVAENDDPVATIVAALSNSTFIVGNLQENRLMHYDSSGNLLKETTCPVQRPIMSIWEDHEKNLLFSSWAESAVVKISPQGKRLQTYKRSRIVGPRWLPNCAISTKDNFVVVADFRLSDVVVFAPDGRCVLEEKVRSVRSPRNLAYDSVRDRIIVSNEDGSLACLQLVHQCYVIDSVSFCEFPLPSQPLPRPPGASTAAQSSPSLHHPLPLARPSSAKAPRPQIKVVVRWIWTMSLLGLETKRPAIGALAFNRHTRQIVVTDTNNRSLRCYDAEGYLVRQHSFQDGGVPTSIACAATVMAAVRSGELLLLNAETYAEKAAPVKIQGSQGNSAATAPLVTVLDNGSFALCRLACNEVTFLDCWGTVTSTIACPARAPLTSISADREDNLVVCSSAWSGRVAVFPQCGGRVQRTVAVAKPLAAVVDRRGFLLAIDGAKEILAVVSPGEEKVLLRERLPGMVSPAFLAYDGDQDQLYVASRTGTLACVTLLRYV